MPSRHIRRPSLENRLGAFCLAARKVAQHSLPLVGIHDRAHRRSRVHLVADVHVLEQPHGLVDKTVVDFLVYEPPRSIAADLSGMKRDRSGELLCRVLHIDVVEDYCRTLAAELQLAGHEIASAGFANEASDLG